jgi:hypothetical protein
MHKHSADQTLAMRLLSCLLFVTLWLAAVPGFAQVAAPANEAAETTGSPKIAQEPAFYSSQVPVLSQSSGDRQAALAAALGQVVVRLTGNSQATSNPVVRKAAAHAEDLVTESQYRQDSETVNGIPVFKTTLVVSFDMTGTDALIAAAGLKYWSGDRPKPILWLVIDDGRGPRLVTGQQLNVVKPLATRGLERGLRFLLPAGTAVEQAATNSIWNLDSAAIQPLTARYGNDTQLLGKIYRSVSGWSAWWVLSRAGVELARWPVTDADPRRVIASGADPAADAFARREAVAIDAGPAGVLAVEVEGVSDQAGFLKLMAYLENLAIVRKVDVVEVTPEHLRLALDLGVGLKGFRALVDTGGVLHSADTSATDDAARFVLQ